MSGDNQIQEFRLNAIAASFDLIANKQPLFSRTDRNGTEHSVTQYSCGYRTITKFKYDIIERWVFSEVSRLLNLALSRHFLLNKRPLLHITWGNDNDHPLRFNIWLCKYAHPNFPFL